MTSLLPFSAVFSALGLNIPAQASASGESIDRTILSLHSVISDPASTPEAATVAKRLLLRLLENPKTAHAKGCRIPAAALYRAAHSPALAKTSQPRPMQRPSLVPRVTIARTPGNRKGRAISSADNSRGDRSEIRHGAVTSKSEEGELSHSSFYDGIGV